MSDNEELQEAGEQDMLGGEEGKERRSPGVERFIQALLLNCQESHQEEC